MVRDENLKFMRNRDVYNSDYFNFTLSLASVNAVCATLFLSFQEANILVYICIIFIYLLPFCAVLSF